MVRSELFVPGIQEDHDTRSSPTTSATRRAPRRPPPRRRPPATGAPALGFTTLEQESVIDELPVSGELPPWLEGSLLRTGPARFEVGSQQMRHWFDGLAMLHRFTIAGGRVSYGGRYLQGRSYRAAQERGRIAYGEFATDPCRSIFKRVQSTVPPRRRADRQRQRQRHPPGRALHRDDRDADARRSSTRTRWTPPGCAPSPRPGQLTTAHPHLDRAGGGDAQLRGQASGRARSYRFFRVAPGLRRSPR